MRQRNNTMRMATLGVVIAASACMLVACGSEDPGSGSSSSRDGSGNCESAWPGVEPSPVDCAAPKLPAQMPTMEQLYEGMEKPPPTTGPPPAKDKTIAIISCGEAVPDCSIPAASGVEAAKVLGWDAKIFDGNFNTGGAYTTAIKTALAQGADAIVVQAIPCSIANAAFRAAIAANVPVIGVDTNDCGQPGGGGGPNVFNPQMQYTEGAVNASQYFYSWGFWSAAYVAQTNPKANVVVLSGETDFIELVNNGFEDGLKAWCADCKILDQVNAPNPVTPAAFTAAVGASLAKHKDSVDTVYSPFDSFLGIYGGAAAVEKAGLRDRIKIIGAIGNTQGFQLLNSGAIDAITQAHSQDWFMWGAMDELNRYFNGEPAVPQGVGVRLVDKDHNNSPNAAGGYNPPIDFRAAYTKLWTS